MIVLLIYYSDSIYLIQIYHKTIVFLFTGIAIAFFVVWKEGNIGSGGLMMG